MPTSAGHVRTAILIPGSGAAGVITIFGTALAESGAGTLLRFSFRAIGVLDAEAAGAMSGQRRL